MSFCYGGRKQATTKFSSLSKSERGLQEIITSTKFKKTPIFLIKVTFLLLSPSSMLKVSKRELKGTLRFFGTFLCRRCTTTT